MEEDEEEAVNIIGRRSVDVQFVSVTEWDYPQHDLLLNEARHFDC